MHESYCGFRLLQTGMISETNGIEGMAMSGALVKQAERSPLSLYEADTFAWANQQAMLLRTGQVDAADLLHIAEEIEDMGKERLHAMASAVRNILVHLTLLKFSPASDPRLHWTEEILNFRVKIEDLLEDSPSLRPHLNDAFLAKQWTKAVRLANPKLGAELSLIGTLPAACPFTLAQVLDDTFIPG